jgi:hypothetical protein
MAFHSRFGYVLVSKSPKPAAPTGNDVMMLEGYETPVFAIKLHNNTNEDTECNFATVSLT